MDDEKGKIALPEQAQATSARENPAAAPAARADKAAVVREVTTEASSSSYLVESSVIDSSFER